MGDHILLANNNNKVTNRVQGTVCERLNTWDFVALTSPMRTHTVSEFWTEVCKTLMDSTGIPAREQAEIKI